MKIFNDACKFLNKCIKCERQSLKNKLEIFTSVKLKFLVRQKTATILLDCLKKSF